MSTKIVITESKQLDINSVPNHTQLPESDATFVKNFQEHHQSILLTDSLKSTLDKIHPDRQYTIGQDCGICMGPMEKNVRRCVINKCQHAFHLECFEEWAKMRTTCPYCRGEIEPGVDQIELPESLVQTISWADMTLTNVSGF